MKNDSQIKPLLVPHKILTLLVGLAIALFIGILVRSNEGYEYSTLWAVVLLTAWVISLITLIYDVIKNPVKRKALFILIFIVSGVFGMLLYLVMRDRIMSDPNL
ncbi:MAG: PLDc N-terminal domain-containing protein [Weeksellaceae bacterium]|nr:PLDc N-terminal domain-containing protein [Weeksellaceae bacterium]